MFWQFARVEHSVACYHKTPAMILKMLLLLPINLGIVIKAISTNLKSIILQQERGFKSGKYSGEVSQENHHKLSAHRMTKNPRAPDQILQTSVNI